MKKIFLIMTIIAAMLCGGFCYAEGDFTIRTESADAKCGDIVSVNINLENNPGILAMRFELTYDTDRLQLMSAVDTGLVGGGIFSPSIEKHPYMMVWNSAASSDYMGDGSLVRLTFTVKETAAAGKAFIKLSYDPADIYNAALEEIAPIISDGSITVIKESTPAPSGGGGGGNYSPSKKPDKNDEKIDNTQPEKTEEDKSKSQMILTIDKKEAIVFGETKTNDVAPIIVNNRTMLPARFVSENLGATVEWNEKTREVTIKGKDVTIVITIDLDTALVNGEKRELDSPAFIKDDRTYTPLRFIAEELGATVEWNEKTREVTITR